VLLGQLALVAAALFTGAAFYINWAEQPARLELDDRSLLAEWKPSYKAGFAMQGSLAAAGALLGVLAAFVHSNGYWMLGAIALGANWPFTLYVIMPVNNQLMQTQAAVAGPQTRGLIQKWGRLHAVRTALGAAATVLFLAASLS
jgi:hypothetical protein